MARTLGITDAKKRDANILMETPTRRARTKQVGPGGAPVRVERLIRTTQETSYDALLARAGSPEGVANLLADGDPEIPTSLVGHRMRDAARVYLREDGTLLGLAHYLQVVKGPDGVEKSRAEFVDVEANIGEEKPALVWSGRLMPIADVVRKFAFTRAVRLVHNSGLTFEFLRDIAATLEAEGKMLLVGGGPRGVDPLILATNGSPYRGFLEGRTDGDGYRLVLHLTQLELKDVVGEVSA